MVQASGLLTAADCQELLGEPTPNGPRVGVVVDGGDPTSPAAELPRPAGPPAGIDAFIVVALGTAGAAAVADLAGSRGLAPPASRIWTVRALADRVSASGLAEWAQESPASGSLGDVRNSATTPLGAALARAGAGDCDGQPMVGGVWWRPGAAIAPSVPFLTVLTRTRGRRVEALRDALCSLSGQTSSDFEVLLLPHNVEDPVLQQLLALVGEFAPEFASRVRVVPVRGGGRSRPLNVGACAARGQYLAILDDDDLALGHWVEAYRALAVASPGAVLRCRVADQPVADACWPAAGSTVAGYAQVGPTQTPWEAHFDVTQHLWDNRSPNCGWALPIGAYRDLGIVFDEELPVLEDWDVLTRAMLACGVSQSPEITSLYRRWQDGGHSLGEHDESQWAAARAAVVSKWAEGTLVPQGMVPTIRELALDRRRAGAFLATAQSPALAPLVEVARRAVVASRPARGGLRRWYRRLRPRLGGLLRRFGLR